MPLKRLDAANSFSNDRRAHPSVLCRHKQPEIDICQAHGGESAAEGLIVVLRPPPLRPPTKSQEILCSPSIRGPCRATRTPYCTSIVTRHHRAPPPAPLLPTAHSGSTRPTQGPHLPQVKICHTPPWRIPTILHAPCRSGSAWLRWQPVGPSGFRNPSAPLDAPAGTVILSDRLTPAAPGSKVISCAGAGL